MSFPSQRADANDEPESLVLSRSQQAAALDLIASRIESVVAHAAIVRQQEATSDLIALSIHTELKRIARLTRAVTLQNKNEVPSRRAVSAGEIAAAARAACLAIARLNGLDCIVTLDDAAFTLTGERSLILLCIAGTVDALSDLLLANPVYQGAADEGIPLQLTIALRSMKTRPALFVEIGCTALPIGTGLAVHFFENSDEDYGRTPAAGILLAAAAHVVRLHGGRADITRHDGAGVTVTYVFPQDAAPGLSRDSR
ncbi:MAG TPA: hypothetical protein VFZ98_07195 [Vicinamibacterales bacterium]